MGKTIEIEEHITVGSLAEQLSIPVTQLITELMKNGVMATVNERLDFDTAQIIVGELDLDTELVRSEAHDLNVHVKREASAQATSRPPVVAVMGHVDHGKTSLLDAIRGANVVKGEAGGITQHISAYQITHNDRLITFLDTPGHEAFAAMREHGARLTDLVVLVVAADDGVKPQTVEAIRFAQKAGVKVLVAINKMDKPEADPNRVKQQLAEHELLVEEWGGDIVTLNVSAKTKQGVDELLDMILLVADVEELKADIELPAEGLIIESHMEQGRGPVAVALIESGTLKPGDFIIAGNTYARVRNLETPDGVKLERAIPSTPVKVVGFKNLPEFGDHFVSANSEKEARALAADQTRQNDNNNAGITGTELIRIMDRSRELTNLNIIVKADVQGSLTSVIDSLKTLNTDEVAVRVVGSGVGAISENDIHLAHSAGAYIYGFNVSLPTSVKQLANRDKISVRLYKVIYELIDDVKTELSNLLAPELVERNIGSLELKAVFKTTKSEIICGGQVTAGKLTIPALVRVLRGKEVVSEAEITNLKRGQQDVKEVFEGELCGVSLKTPAKLVVEVGDVIEAFSREVVARSL